ncbi:DNA-binding transcriptional regulator, MurR/RpiR family, contains HTH and SIS domains [Mesobacillus persicus]|uniref:DNA-binding transcriptional regulator, MurR/RpiR family, contains HTH and SIS domains n=1 Tax=Mesobacillus persicus TaxID=930146 RepID=A0A1H8FDW7_9BACI|nr:MurR/RpiR family transcriptional regulator [Mesobacillus persicus]SEN29796.1 DNA-binding transcriptional regulator, MurR/RpiR family, contains HTH and SIS domains [Mesobacillus persicus]
MTDLQAPPCFTRIRAIYPQLSEKEKTIATLILNEPEKIIHSTISEIAGDLNVADATVFRFCKRLGFKGYQALKIALASENTSPITEIHEKITEHDDEEAIIRKIFKSNIRTLEDTVQVINMEHFREATKALISARKIDFYGSGGSGAIAMDAHHKFLRSGLLSSCYNDSHLQLMSAAQLSKGDVVVCISHSGTSKDIIEVLKVAKLNGVKTIGITHYADTPVTQLADISLLTVSEETEFRSEALASRLAQLSIIDALYVSVCFQMKDEVKTSLQKLRKAISVKRI